MGKYDLTNKISYLSELFDVFEKDIDGTINSKLNGLKEDGYTSKLIKGTNDEILAIKSFKINAKKKKTINISVSSDVLTSIIVSDPTENKRYVQWILNIFTLKIKDDELAEEQKGIRLIEEDLFQAKEYIILFESNKRKDKFKKLCHSNTNFKDISDVTNINQYKSLSMLFDAVYPFVERDVSLMERKLLKYLELGEALIPVSDRNYMVYVPLTLDASTVFNDFSVWCTSKFENGNFISYTRNNRLPDGNISNLYIIINKDFFEDDNLDIYQIHFETNQLMNKKNSNDIKGINHILSRSQPLFDFFKALLIKNAKLTNNDFTQNKYYLNGIKLNLIDNVFDVVNEKAEIIKIMEIPIGVVPKFNDFKNVCHLIITDTGLSELDESIGDLSELKLLALTNNKLKTLPISIGKLSKLVFLNLNGNKMIDFPNEISKLDIKNGGSLIRVGIKKSEIGEKNYNKLKKLLPSAVLI